MNNLIKTILFILFISIVSLNANVPKGNQCKISSFLRKISYLLLVIQGFSIGFFTFRVGVRG